MIMMIRLIAKYKNLQMILKSTTEWILWKVLRVCKSIYVI